MSRFTPNPDFDRAFDAGAIVWDANDIPVRVRIPVDVTRVRTYVLTDEHSWYAAHSG